VSGAGSSRVLMICAEPVGERPLGVAIRTLELAKVLSDHAEVTIAGVDPSTGVPDGPPVVSYKLFGSPRRSGLSELVAQADAIVAQPPWPHLAALLRRAPARIVYDVYDPEPFEVAERLRDDGAAKRRLVTTLSTDRVMRGLADADHLMCASEKQRDLWLGAMLGERMLAPEEQYRDPSLRSRIDCVPFGLPTAAPVSLGPGARARFPQIGADDELVLWNGGIWAWLDAPSAIRAIALLRERRPRVRLVFMGASTLPAARRSAGEARELAAELGVLDTHVFFNDEWVAYERRADWLMEADCVLSAQSDHLETRFAFRTRLLDAIWAGLPIVCTSGDDLAEQVEREGLGATAAAGSPESLAAALEQVLGAGRDSFAARLAAVAPRYAWPTVAAPLLEWVTASEPPPPRSRAGIPLGQRLRDAGFRAALSALHAARVERLPSL
jgi:glycosyltransferase involved in cell wall biosynthesis